MLLSYFESKNNFTFLEHVLAGIIIFNLVGSPNIEEQTK